MAKSSNGTLSRIVIRSRIERLRQFLSTTAIPEADAPLPDLLAFLREMKNIQGNTSNWMSLVATMLAEGFLCELHGIAPFGADAKAQGAPGLDNNTVLPDGRRLIGEIKTTIPYQDRDFGAQQSKSFERDFRKLNQTPADFKYFFVVERGTFDAMKRRYQQQIPGVIVVLLPDGEKFLCGPNAN